MASNKLLKSNRRGKGVEPLTPVLEAHHSERRDVIKGRGAKRADPTVPCAPSSLARRSADDHRRGSSRPGPRLGIIYTTA